MMTQLFRIGGFLPYVSMIFLNAFVDLGHKIIIQNTLFKVYDGDTQILLTAIVNALILLPFVLLFSPSGFLADRFPKNIVMRVSAWVAVCVTLAITACYYLGWFWPAFAMTFVLAMQSAIYSPAKFGYIKEIAGEEALATANGLVQAVSTTAILAGIFVFSFLFEQFLADHDYSTPGEVMDLVAPVGWFLVAFACVELILAYRLPALRKTVSGMHFDWQDYRTGRYLKTNLAEAYGNQVIWLSIVGLSIFWGIGQVMLASFPAFAKESLGETNTVVIQGAMACFGIGIVIGSVIAGRVSRNHIETGLVPIGALGVAATLFLLPGLPSATAHALNFLATGILAGFFIVPLNSLIQFNAGNTGLGRILAANNFIQNIVMLAFLAATVVAARLQSGSVFIIAMLGLIALIGAVYTIYKLPQSLVRFLVARIIATRYRLEVIGLKNLPAEGAVLLLGNHISWIDWAMVQIATPRPVRFVLTRVIYEKWYLRWFFDFFGVVPISSSNSREAIRTITDLLKDGQVVCLFPEGHISRNGQLGEFKKGFELSASRVGEGVILPFYLRGLWGSGFSFASAKLRENRGAYRPRDVIMAFGHPLPLESTAEQVKQSVFELSVSSWQTHTETLSTLPKAWLRRARRRPGQLAAIDSVGTTLTNRRLMAAAFLFARRIRRMGTEQNLGILMPASSAGAIANLAGLLVGRTVVNLNYTASRDSLRAGIESAGIRHVLTSKRFLKKLAGRGIEAASLFDGIELHQMEDIREGIGKAEALMMLAASSLLPSGLVLGLFGHRARPDDTAAILFSSGSEGSPKGIELSHRNIMANVSQISDVLNTEGEDVILSNLPLFHAFGLTVTTFMPLLEGIPMLCHPDPTDALGCAKAIARHRATILCSTSTFLRLYTRNKHIHPIMLEPLRIVVAGAERLNPDVRETFALKFNKPIFEGYGATETTPVASVNLPDLLETTDWQVQVGSKPGTVGMPLPGTSFRIVDPVTLEHLPPGQDGLILIGGVQVMKGYLNDPDKTAEVIIELDGQRWYKTGDKGHQDEDGFLTIVDRYSRFAKLGGEMISLSALEEKARRVLKQPEMELVAVTVPDERKGERIILLVAADDIDPDGLRKAMVAAGVNPLEIPAEIRGVEQVPKLGSGKTDFAAAKRMAREPDTTGPKFR